MLVAVLALAVGFSSVAAVIGMQVVRMAASLPQYEETIQYKLADLNELTVGQLNLLSGQAGRIISQHAEKAPTPESLERAGEGRTAVPVPVEIHNPPTNPLQVIRRVLASVWAPLETAGIVLVVLVFVLLEHEALRDRFIRIAGGTDIRATTLALNDAGERLSRFFVSQFAVNLGVGGVISVGLTVIGLPHALLWAALAAVLRFVPYVGIWIAALFAAVLAAAVDPGWSLAITTLGLFVIVELIAGQLVEPQLYGHTTGLSPLSVVISAIFWSWLWGPVGLIVSTPLTLCLVVAGRHIKALSLLDILLGDNQALTMPQRFYQRALSADSDEIIESARAFLKRNSFAAYCDVVLMPALYLARLDLTTGAISEEQQTRVRDVMVAVIEAIGGVARRISRRRSRVSVLDRTTAGLQLRQQREAAYGRYQGPLAVPPGSVMICVGMGSSSDDLATELLVRILRDQKVDARHLSIDDLNAPAPPDSSPDSIAVVYMVSAFPSAERDRSESVADIIRRRFPGARLVTLFLPGMLLQSGSAVDSVRSADSTATSFGHAVQICLSLQSDKQKTAKLARSMTAALRLARSQAHILRIRWRIFSFLFGFGFLAYVQRQTITVAAERMMPDLSFTQAQIGWLEQAFVLGYAIFQMPGGLFGQRIGARRTFVIIGLTAFCATIATPLVPNFCRGTALFVVLLAVQAILGCAQGAVFPVSAGVFEAWFPPHRWSLVQGLQTMGLGLGAAFTLPLIASLMAAQGWQSALIWSSLPALPLIGLWAWYGRNTPRQHPQVSRQELAEIGAERPPLTPSLNLKNLVRLLGDRNVLLLALSYMTMNYAFYLLSNWVFLYLVQERQFSVLQSGWLAAAPQLAGALGAGVGGWVTGKMCQRLGDRWGYRLVPLAALPVSALLLMFAVSVANPYVAVAALAACFGCVELTEGAFWAAGMNMGHEDTMSVCGFMNTGGNLGGIISIPIVAHLSGLHLWYTAFLIGAAFAVVSALAWLGIQVGKPEDRGRRRTGEDRVAGDGVATAALVGQSKHSAT